MSHGGNADEEGEKKGMGKKRVKIEIGTINSARINEKIDTGRTDLREAERMLKRSDAILKSNSTYMYHHTPQSTPEVCSRDH